MSVLILLLFSRIMNSFPIIYPLIPSGQIYTFTTTNEVEYEVRFARKKDNPLHVSIVFGVLNEEYDGEEYSLTNKGEVYRVMATIVKITKNYFKEHPHINIFEFAGEPTASEKTKIPQKRLNLYQRYLPQVFDDSWVSLRQGNQIILLKKKKP